MGFITLSEFLEADKKVQKAILEWRPVTECEVAVEGDECVFSLESTGRALEIEDEYGIKYIPYLGVEELVDFIEHITGEMIEGIDICCDMYWLKPGENENAEWVKEEMSFCDENLLQAVWKAAKGVTLYS